MGIVISSTRELESGAGFYGFSGEVACDTNSKSVIIIQNTSYRDTLIELTFSASFNASDLTTGSISNFQTILNDVVISNIKLVSIDPNVNNPQYATFSFFAPRHSTVRVDQLDSDTTGKCTTTLRGYYMEPPVKQQA